VLKDKNHSYKMVPVPRAISSSCGTALCCDCSSLPVIRKCLLDNLLEMEGFYRLQEVGLKNPEVEELVYDE
jgi:hypothetical protein